MNNVLFVHGWATDRWVWEGCAGSLSGENIINLDLPGHGGEGAWNKATLEPAVERLSRAVSGLEDGSVIGIGWSLGAQALLASFKGLKAKFKGLVFVSATPCFTERPDFPWGQSKFLVKRMILDMKKDPEGALKRFYTLNFTETELSADGARSFLERYKYPGPVDCSTDIPGCLPSFRYGEITNALEALNSADLRPEIQTLSVPLLVIHGEDDTVTPVQAGRFLASSTRVAHIETFPGAGHAPFLTQPDKFNKMVKDFISIL